VPADVRLIETTNLQIEESALTGESVATHKHPDPVDEDAGIGDRSGMAFSGTLVTSGRGVGVVTATGVATEIGRINTMIGEVETLATPLTRQMTTFGKQLSAAIVVLAVVVFLGLCCTTTRSPSCSSLPSVSPWRRSPRVSPQSSPSPWRSACSGWRDATRSPVDSTRSRPSVRSR
jgi:magnesium-transporting ATPase (P-type)